MATTIQTIVDIARRHVVESTASFWSDAELVALCNRGIRDLWRAINDNYQDYFFTNDESNVSMAASTGTLTGVPADCAIVRGIEPRVLGTYPDVIFKPLNYNHPEFSNARTTQAINPNSGGVIWYHLSGAGAPVAAPTIYVAPQLTSAVPLRLIYVPTLTEKVIANDNPIPGESDNALVCWTVAYMRAKEREDRSPDPEWLTLYGTEKTNILVSLTPRQHDEEEIVEAMFESYWP
ncbi:MAG: hypothetical protein ABWY78_06245 [Microvirga sp.]